MDMGQMVVGIDSKLDKLPLIQNVFENLIHTKFEMWITFEKRVVHPSKNTFPNEREGCSILLLRYEEMGPKLEQMKPCVVFHDGQLDSELINHSCQHAGLPLGFFSIDKFRMGEEEFSEIARFEKVIKDFIRRQLAKEVKEESLSKPIGWKVKMSDAYHSQVTLLSDRNMRHLMGMIQKTIRKLEPFAASMKQYRKDRKIDQVVTQLSGIEHSSSSQDVPKYQGLLAKHFQDPFPMIHRIPTVLIEGPTGTGKTLVAEMIHKELSELPFVKIPLVNISQEIVDSELFGVIPGHYTDAQLRMGKILHHAGGIIFLDEIGEIPLPIQTKLLTYLDDMTIQILGWSSPNPIRVPTMIIAATNRNLRQEVSLGRFRLDLYHRFSYRIRVPSLKERFDDFRFLISFALQKQKAIEGAAVEQISIKAIEKLETYDFPGNFRELESILSLAMAYAEQEERTTILAEDIKFT